MKTYFNFLCSIFVFCLISCSEEVLNQAVILSKEAPLPLNESDISIRNIGGGAVIHYTLPVSENISFLEAQYKLTTGEKIKVRSSALSDSIKVEGYMDTENHDVHLYVISKSNIYSEALTVTIHPQKAPLIKVRESLEVEEDFGGMRLKWKNEDQSPMAIFISQVNGSDTTYISACYSKKENGQYTVRGLEAKKNTFLFRIRDKFQNYSDYKTVELTPLYESELNYSNFTIMSDRYFKNTLPAGMNIWWDGKRWQPFWPTESKLPWYASVDMKKSIKLSRFVIWQYAWPFNDYGHFYSGCNGRVYNVYGSNNPSGDGGMDGWNLIMTCEIKLPSGNPINNYRDGMTDEDFDVAKNRGHEFIVPLETPAYRYLRFEGVKNFEDGGGLGSCSEFQIFGDDRK